MMRSKPQESSGAVGSYDAQTVNHVVVSLEKGRMMARSPTVLWCDQCGAWQPCRSENYVGSSEVGQMEFKDGSRAFRRHRVCEDCRSEFFTLEINETSVVARDKALQTIEKAIAKLK